MLLAVVIVSPFIGAAGCGSRALTDGADGMGGSGGGGAAGGWVDAGGDATAADSGSCPTEAPGGAAFTFHLRNDAADPVYLSFGCGQNPPLTIDTPAGPLGIGPESADLCAFTCDPVIAGENGPYSCTDCGPGQLRTLAPGDTLDVGWDRRVWERVTIAPSCSGLDAAASCALGVAIAGPNATGTVTYCGQLPPTSACQSARTASFTADLTADALDVSLN